VGALWWAKPPTNQQTSGGVHMTNTVKVLEHENLRNRVTYKIETVDMHGRVHVYTLWAQKERHGKFIDWYLYIITHDPVTHRTISSKKVAAKHYKQNIVKMMKRAIRQPSYFDALKKDLAV